MNASVTDVQTSSSYNLKRLRLLRARRRAAAIANRATQMLVLVCFVVITAFTLMQLIPGSVANLYLAMEASPEQVAQFERELGLDRSYAEQLISVAGQLLTGNLGYSWYYRIPVWDLILQKLPATLLLVGSGLLVAWALGIGLGVVAAWKEGTRWEATIRLGTAALAAQPEFMIGVALVLLAAAILPGLPTSGMASPGLSGTAAIFDRLGHVIAPALAMGLARTAVHARITLQSLLLAKHQDFVLAHRASGFANGRILLTYVMPHAFLALSTILGLELRSLFTGAVATEVIFAWPGVGRLIFDGIGNRDFPLVIGLFFFVSVLTMLINLATDVAYTLIDPRVRAGEPGRAAA